MLHYNSKSYLSFNRLDNKRYLLLTEEKIFFKSTNQKQELLWQPCLLTDRDEMSNLYRGPSIDASYHISDQLALRFQRRRLKCEKLTDNRRWTPSDGKSSHCL